MSECVTSPIEFRAFSSSSSSSPPSENPLPDTPKNIKSRPPVGVCISCLRIEKQERLPSSGGGLVGDVAVRRMKKASRGWKNPKDKQSRSGLDCEKEQKSWHRLATSGLDSRNAINDNVPIGGQIASPDSSPSLMPHQKAQFPGKQTRCALSR